MLALMIFLTLLAVTAVLIAVYVAAAWIARHKPDSPWGQALSPFFPQYAAQGRQEAETIQRKIRHAAVPTAAQTKAQKRWSFRALEAPSDSMAVTFPDSGENKTLGVVGTLRTVELFQRDDSRRDNPWYGTGQDFVFQVLKGRRDAWIFEAPGILALVYTIEQVGDSTVQSYVDEARLFGQSNQRGTDIWIQWGRKRYFLYDIGRLGIHSAKGDVPSWRAAPYDPGDNPWRDDYIVKFILAGPTGGELARHQPEDPFMAVIAPVFGTGGYVLTGQLIDETYLQDVREEG